MSRKKPAKYIALAIVFFATYILGIYSTIFFSGVEQLARSLYIDFKLAVKDVAGFEKESSRKFTKSEYSFTESEVASLIRINSSSDIIQKRQQLIQEIWKSSKFPETQSFNKIIKGYKFPDDSGHHLASTIKLPKDINVDLYELEMEFGFRARLYHLIPKNKKNVLLVYYASHSPYFFMQPVLEFLKQGYEVVYMEMPLITSHISHPDMVIVLDENNVEKTRYIPIKVSRLGELIFRQNHNSLLMLESKNFSPMKFFVHPVAVILNLLTSENSYDQIAMTGISGGGWATTLYSAIDNRIQLSYPVAGTLPLFLMGREPISSIVGDYEQVNPRIYLEIANYLELYVMGSAEKNRRQLQILNIYDQCCMPGILGDHYKSVVEERVRKINLGGNYKLYQDYSIVAHDYSDDAMELIIKDIGSGL